MKKEPVKVTEDDCWDSYDEEDNEAKPVVPTPKN